MIGPINTKSLPRAADKKSLKAIIEAVGTNVIRDPYIFYDWKDTTGERFQAGNSILYPGCRTGGHSHDDAEEVYFVKSGNGIMHIGEKAFEVCEGDSWVVPLYEPHWTENLGNLPLEMFWIVIKV